MNRIDDLLNKVNKLQVYSRNKQLNLHPHPIKKIPNTNHSLNSEFSLNES